MPERPDTGIRWSARHFQAQLLPGTVPISVHVMERYDATRAARHAQQRAERHEAVLRSIIVPSHCPACGHDLVADQITGASTAPTVPAPGIDAHTSPPLLDHRLPRVLMTLVVEAISGHRPTSQLASVAEPSVIRYVRAEAQRAWATPPMVLRTLHVQPAGDSAVDLFGLVGVGRRCLAYSARLELRAHGWQIILLRLLHDSAAQRGGGSNPGGRRTGARAGGTS